MNFRIYLTFLFLSTTLNLVGLTKNNEAIGSKSVAFSDIYHFQQVSSTLLKKYLKADSLFVAKNYTESIELATEVLYESKEAQNNEIYSLTNYLIAKIWYKIGSYEKSIKFFRNSIALFEANKLDALKIDEIHSDIESDFLFVENKFKLAATYHRLLENHDSILKYKDSSLYYYNEVLSSNSLKKDIRKLQSKTYINLAGIYMHDSLFEEAEGYAEKSIEIEKEFTQNFFDLAAAYGNLASIYLMKEDYEKSKETTNKALDYIANVKGERIDRIKADLYFNLAYAMYMLKDYKAYEFQEISYNIYDLIIDDELKKIIEQKTAEKTYDIGKLKGKEEEVEKKRKAQMFSWIIGISSFFVIVLLIFLLNQYKLRQKNLGLELSKRELIQQQKLEKVKAESQIRILNATLDGKESERKQIAETLHDSVSALLSSANLHLQACKTQFNGKTPIEVDKSQSIINEASQKIRDLSHTLVSSILLKFGLSFAIKDIAEKFSNSELQIDHDTRYIKRYDQRFEIKLYNIIQEFINNILKHSQASHALITLVEKNKKLILIIEDNGQGFDKETIPEKDGLGINQIDARIQMMKGKFNIESGKGKGTKITIELPVFEKEPVTIS